MKKKLLPLIGTIYLPGFFFWLMLGISQPTLPLFLTDIDVNLALIGWVVSSEALGSVIGAIPANNLQSRMPTRNFMLVGFGIVFLACLVLMQEAVIALIFVAWVTVGVGGVLIGLATHQLITQIDAEIRGRAVAVFGGVFRLASTLGPALGGFLAGNLSYAAAFAAMAGCIVLGAGVVFLFVPNTLDPSLQQPATDVTAASETALPYWQQLKNTVVDNRQILGPSVVGLAFFQAVRRARKILIPLIGSQLLSLNVEQVGYVLSIVSFVDTLFFLPAGVIMDRFGRKFAIVPSLLGQALGFLLLPLAWGFGSLALFASVIGVANGLSSGAMMTLGADLAPENQRIPFLGIWKMSSLAGHFLGPNIVGGLAGLFTLAVSSYGIATVGLIAASLFAFMVPETLKKERETGAM